MRLFVFLMLLCLTFPMSVSAFTTTEAQQCANRLLNAYNQRVYPKGMLAEEEITERAFGNVFRQLTAEEMEDAINDTASVLRESFINPTGRYQFDNLVVESTEPTKNGHRIIGIVHVTTPKFVGNTSFVALVRPGCKIYQSRIGDIYTLDGSVRDALLKKKRWNSLLD